MKIALLCYDTRGGVQPYVALGLGLRQAGHDVRAVAPSDLASMFGEVGMPVAPLAGSIEAVLRGSGATVDRGLVASMRFAAQQMPQRIREWTHQTLAACEGADLLTGGVGGMVIGLSVAERLGVPFLQTHLQPVGMQAASYPGPLASWMPRWLGPWGNAASHRLSNALVWAPFSRAMASARIELLGPRRTAAAPRPAMPVL